MGALRCVVAGLLLLGLPAAAAADQHDALMQEVAAFGDALAEAMLAGDLDTMLGMYTEDAISLPNYGPRMDGIAAFRQQHDQMSAAGLKFLSFTSDPTDVWKAGDQVIEIGTFEITLEMPGMPGPIKDKGKYLTVYVRDAEGSLKIKAETWNTDLNPMEMAAPGHEQEQEAEEAED